MAPWEDCCQQGSGGHVVPLEQMPQCSCGSSKHTNDIHSCTTQNALQSAAAKDFPALTATATTGAHLEVGTQQGA